MGYFLKNNWHDKFKPSFLNKNTFYIISRLYFLFRLPCVVGLLIRIEWPLMTFVSKTGKKVKLFLTESRSSISKKKTLFSIFWDLLTSAKFNQKTLLSSSLSLVYYYRQIFHPVQKLETSHILIYRTKLFSVPNIGLLQCNPYWVTCNHYCKGKIFPTQFKR